MLLGRLIVVSTLWMVVVLTAPGCDDQAASARPAAESPREPVLPAKTRPNDNELAQSYVTCRATLKDVDNNHRWSEDSAVGHDEGVAPLASLVLVEPVSHADRVIGILFKYASHGASTPLAAADIGRQFSVEVPTEFLQGKSSTVDNLSVRQLRRIER